MAETSIEWTDFTWNPVSGCTKVSQGCKHCYAERVFPRAYAKAFVAIHHPRGAQGPLSGQEEESRRRRFTDVQCHPDRLLQPWHMTKGRRIFVNSMSDLFHEDVPFEFIAKVFWVMSVTTRHTYQVLTKRPQRMLDFFKWSHGGFEPDSWFAGARIGDEGHKIGIDWKPWREGGKRGGYDNCGPGWPYENVWLGVSVEDQQTANERIPLLLDAPAAVRFLSCEPLLGPINLRVIDLDGHSEIYPLRGTDGCQDDDGEPLPDLPRVDWVIAGGESGPHARPMHPDWARTLRDQCAEAGVAFLFKQWGAWANGSDAGCNGIAIDRRGRIASDGADRATYPPAADSSDGWAMMHRAGKKAAGRLLDGRVHDEYP